MISMCNMLIIKLMFWDKRSDGDKNLGISRKDRERMRENARPFREQFEKWIEYNQVKENNYEDN